VETVVDELVDLGDRPGHHRPGRKVLTLVHAMVAGGDAIDDADVLRTGRTQQVLGHRVMAPSTLGTFLRSFTFGHIRQLDRVAETLLARAWSAGAGPGTQELTMDLDSTVCEVHGHAKGGAAYGYTHRLGYHPLLASRADTGELLHLRMRTGSANTARGAERFVNELAGRVRRAGARGPLTLRGDSGFWSAKVLDACRRHGIGFSITVRQTKLVTAAIAAIGEDAWTDIDYPDGGAAQVAETTLAGKAGGRLIVRRTRLIGAQATLWPDWRHHAFVTDRAGTAVWLDADHRRHAVVELAIRDLKQGSVPLPVRGVRRQCRLGAGGHPRAQPAALGGRARARRPRSGGGQDDPTALHHPARPAHPLRTAPLLAPTVGLAVGRGLPGRPGPPARAPAANLTPSTPEPSHRYHCLGLRQACPDHRPPSPETIVGNPLTPRQQPIPLWLPHHTPATAATLSVAA
jgi:Transposase DDE domain group 1